VFTNAAKVLGCIQSLMECPIQQDREISAKVDVILDKGQNISIEGWTDRLQGAQFRQKKYELERDVHTLSFNVAEGHRLMTIKIFPARPYCGLEVHGSHLQTRHPYIDYWTSDVRDVNIGQLAIKIGNGLSRRGIDYISLTPELLQRCGYQTYGENCSHRFVLSSSKQQYRAAQGIIINYDGMTDDFMLQQYADSSLTNKNDVYKFAGQLCKHLTFIDYPTGYHGIW